MFKVSVIIPVYNAEEYLEESLDSVFNQTLDDIEIICVDDGSTDNSWKMLNDFADTHKNMKIFHQENNGGGAARNYALDYVEGKYIYFMDADDILDLNALKECYEISEEKNLDFLIFKAINYDEDTDSYYDTPIYLMDELHEFVGDKVFSFADLGDYIFKINVTPWSKFYNSEFVRATGSKFAEGLIFHDNIFYWGIIFHAKRMYFYDKILYTRRRHSKSSTGAGDQRFVSTLAINNLIIQRFKENNHLEEYKKRIYNRKINLAFMRYKEVHDQYKEYFYERMKEDFSKLIGHEQYDDCMKNLFIFNRNRFESVVYSNNFEEFNILLRNATLRKENSALNAKIKKAEKLDEPLNNLKSWKLISG